MHRGSNSSPESSTYLNDKLISGNPRTSERKASSRLSMSLVIIGAIVLIWAVVLVGTGGALDNTRLFHSSFLVSKEGQLEESDCYMVSCNPRSLREATEAMAVNPSACYRLACATTAMQEYAKLHADLKS